MLSVNIKQPKKKYFFQDIFDSANKNAIYTGISIIHAISTKNSPILLIVNL